MTDKQSKYHVFLRSGGSVYLCATLHCAILPEEPLWSLL